jgi:hypothetical protein
MIGFYELICTQSIMIVCKFSIQYNGRVFVFLNNTCNHLQQKKSHVFLKKLLTVNLVYSLQLLHELKMEVHV